MCMVTSTGMGDVCAWQRISVLVSSCLHAFMLPIESCLGIVDCWIELHQSAKQETVFDERSSDIGNCHCCNAMSVVVSE